MEPTMTDAGLLTEVAVAKLRFRCLQECVLMEVYPSSLVELRTSVRGKYSRFRYTPQKALVLFCSSGVS